MNYYEASSAPHYTIDMGHDDSTASSRKGKIGDPVAKTVSVQYSFRALLLYSLRLGTFGFGGPIALAGRMEKDLVATRGWISRQDYIEGLAFSQLSPGPLAAQLAMYLGWVRAGRVGALLMSGAFVLPSFTMAVGLAAVYVHVGQLAWIQDMFYGIGAAVSRGLFYWLVFAGVAITTVWTGLEIVWLFVLCGVMSIVVNAPPGFLSKAHVRSVAGGMGWLAAFRGLQPWVRSPSSFCSS
jgi:chromate transporter